MGGTRGPTHCRSVSTQVQTGLAFYVHRLHVPVPGGDRSWWEVLRTSPILGPDRTQRFLYGIIFRSARLGRCSTRQLRDHRSRAAQESTRWGCEPQTLGPISQRQGFYTDRLLGESTPLLHENVGVLIQVRRKLKRKSTWPSPRRAPGCQQLRRRELRSEFPRGGVGGQ